MARSRIPPHVAGLPAWWANLQLSDKGNPKRLLSNAALPFEHDPAFVNKFSFDKFQRKLFVNGPLPWRQNPPTGLYELEDSDELQAWRWLEDMNVPADRRLTMHAIALAAYAQTFHPVLDYFASLPVWDQVARIDTWTVDYLGVTDTPLVRAQSAAWMISAVARVHDPGCQADYALVLEGRQGDLRRGKSTALRILGQLWYTDDIAELGTKDAAEQVVGKWIIELSELEAMMRSDPARTKSFISRRVGRFRWSYDPAVREYPRQCVFAGTVNDQNWSRDPTGNRRFWPMWCNHVDCVGLEAARPQLFAEALERYNLGEHWWIEDQSLVVEAREAQELRYPQDPWEDQIVAYLNKQLENHDSNGAIVFQNVVSISELLQNLNIPNDKHSIREQIRLANILQRHKWTKKRIPYNEHGRVADLKDITTDRKWRYVPSGYDPVTRNIPGKDS